MSSRNVSSSVHQVNSLGKTTGHRIPFRRDVDPLGRGPAWVPFIRVLRALDLAGPEEMIQNPELQAIVGHEATQLMRFETEHRGYRDMVGVRADCLAAALDGWKRRGETAAQRHAINTINNFFDITQVGLKAAPKETRMLDLTAELMKPVDIYTEVATQVQERMADPVPVEVQTFESKFGKTRVVMFSDGSPWFVAKDVCEALGMNISKGASNLTWRLHNGQKMKAKLPLISNRGQTLDLGETKMVRHLLLINRGGFNDLILESRKPVAREYRQWITDTVLPALQDTGTFTDEGVALI